MLNSMTNIVLSCMVGFAQAQNIGIGFSLALDYGVASVVGEDGWTRDIAKISGSVFYRDTMNAAGSMPSDIEVIPSEIPDGPPGEPETTCGNMYDDVYERRMPAPIGLQTIYNQLPPWL